MILKIISLLRYLNFDFKPTLTAFFDSLADSFRPTGNVWHADDVMTDKGSRGKMERYKTGVGVWRYMDVKMYIYLASFLAKTATGVAVSNIGPNKGLRLFSTVLQRIHLSIFTLNSLDYLFYGVHAVLHASISKVLEKGFIFQYLMVVIVCSLNFIDYLLLFNTLINK